MFVKVIFVLYHSVCQCTTLYLPVLPYFRHTWRARSGRWGYRVGRQVEHGPAWRGRFGLAAFPPARYARFAIDSYLIGVDLPSAAPAEAPWFFIHDSRDLPNHRQGLRELSTLDEFFSASRKWTAAHEGKGEASVCSAGSISTQNLTSTPGGVIDSRKVFRYLPTIIHRRADDHPLLLVSGAIQLVNRAKRQRENRGGQAEEKKEGRKETESTNDFSFLALGAAMRLQQFPTHCHRELASEGCIELDEAKCVRPDRWRFNRFKITAR